MNGLLKIKSFTKQDTIQLFQVLEKIDGSELISLLEKILQKFDKCRECGKIIDLDSHVFALHDTEGYICWDCLMWEEKVKY